MCTSTVRCSPGGRGPDAFQQVRAGDALEEIAGVLRDRSKLITAADRETVAGGQGPQPGGARRGRGAGSGGRAAAVLPDQPDAGRDVPACGLGCLARSRDAIQAYLAS